MSTATLAAPEARRPVRHRVLRITAAVTALVAVSVAVLAGVLVAVLWAATPPVGDLLQRARAVQAGHGETPVLDAPPPRVVSALVATEDSRFFSDAGIDGPGAVRGVLGVLAGDADAGGASLDQQLAKVLYVPRGDVVGKLEQVVVGVTIDATWSKQDVLRAYLGGVYFGHGFWGLDAAARGYFGVPADGLSTGQAALLAGLVQAPTDYDPDLHLDLALQRRVHVLDRMVATGALTPEQSAAAAAAPLGLLTNGGAR